jgi:hypothetical protein
MAKKPRPKPAPIQSAAQRSATHRRWVRWWRVLFDDIKTIAHHRDLYRQVAAMVEQNPALHVPSVFYDWMQRAYWMGQAVAIRRLVDWDSRSISLIRLIDQISDHPEVLSRRRYVRHYKNPRMKQMAHRHFDQMARPGADQMSRRTILGHRRELLVAHRRVRVFVNKHVAHRDKHPMRRLPTYAEFDGCVDVLEKLAEKYSLILKAEGTDVVPTIIGDWKKPFRVAWIQSVPEQ